MSDHTAKDTFNIARNQQSLYSDSFNGSAASNSASFDHHQRWDFLALITAISAVYQRGRYVAMQPLNDLELLPVNGGRDYEVSRTILHSTTVSILDQADTNICKSKVIVKRLQKDLKSNPMTPESMALFIREICVLNRLHGHENIVELLGVGWFYDYAQDQAQTPCPKPAVILEQAAGTLQHWIERARGPSFQTEMGICRDVANGLHALHVLGLVHGDIKPANVLFFRRVTSEGGSKVEQIQCKISDFSLSQPAGKIRQWYDWGSKNYRAPEIGSELGPDELLLTDVWSLGILFAAVTERDLGLVGARHEAEAFGSLSHQLDLVRARHEAEALGSLIHQRVQISVQESSWKPELVCARLEIFRHTLQHDARRRSLDRVVAELNGFFKPVALDDNTLKVPESHEHLLLPTMDSLNISYEHFKHVSGQVKDAILVRLKHVAADEEDARQSEALVHLSMITLSGYCCPFSTLTDGMVYLKQAAAAGNITAQGIFCRVQNALLPGLFPTPSEKSLSWLESAASLGNDMAREDLCALDVKRARMSRCRYLSAQSSLIIMASSAKGNQPAGSSGSHTTTPAHAAAVMGDLDALSLAIESDSECILAKDSDGNTPLIQAARYEHADMALRILDLGADLTATNNNGENFLHFAICFAERALSTIMHMTERWESLYTQEALATEPDSTHGHPGLPAGTPLDRAVALNKPRSVHLLLQSMRSFLVSNGLIIRRCLLLAFQLHHCEIQKTLIEFAQMDSPLRNPGLAHLHNTTWDYKGTKRSYLDAVVVGCVSGISQGVDVPLRWWRICHLGEASQSAVQRSMELALSIVPESEAKEQAVDGAIALGMAERYHDSIHALIAVKAEITTGHAGRLTDLRSLAWKSVPVPRPLLRKLHEDYWFASFIPLGWTRHLHRFQVSQAEIYQRTHPDQLSFADFRPEVAIQSGKMSGELLEREEVLVSYVDQILYHERNGTLLHQSVIAGDRATFAMLVDCYDASVSIPAPGRDMPPHDVNQVNLYALLAHTKHGDVWFANQFQKLKLPISFPLTSTPWTNDFHLPPLYHALQARRWPLARWLIRHGADLTEPTKPGWDVLSTALSYNTLNKELLEFIFPTSRKGDNVFASLPSHLQEKDGFEVFTLVHDCYRKMLDTWPIPGDVFVDLPYGKAQRVLGHSGAATMHKTVIPGTDLEDNDESMTENSYSSDDQAPVPRPRDVDQLLNGRGDSYSFRTHWWKLRGMDQTRLADCWRYLLNTYPEVCDCPERWRAVTLPKLLSTGPPRRLWIRHKPKSILEQSLSLGEGSSALFTMTMAEFQHDLRRKSTPFPRQSWLDLLLRSSPLDRLTVRSWKTTALFHRYGYWPSLRSFVLYGPIVYVAVTVLLWKAARYYVRLVWRYGPSDREGDDDDDRAFQPVVAAVYYILLYGGLIVALGSWCVYLWLLSKYWVRRISPDFLPRLAARLDI